MPSFGHSKFFPVFLYQKGLNKFAMCIFGHSEFIPVFLGKDCQKNSEWPFLAILNLFQSSWEKLLEKFQNGHFWPIRIYISLFGEKLLEIIQNGHFWPFWIYTSHFGRNCWKKFGTAIFGHSKFILVFWEKLSGKIWNIHITLTECNDLESNEICTFLDFNSEI